MAILFVPVAILIVAWGLWQDATGQCPCAICEVIREYEFEREKEAADEARYDVEQGPYR